MNVYSQLFYTREIVRDIKDPDVLRKILEKYHSKKALQNSKNRVCKTKNCNTILSRYNEEKICGACQVNRFKDRLEGWGWDRAKLDEDWSY